jgi:hypothetical protein
MGPFRIMFLIIMLRLQVMYPHTESLFFPLLLVSSVRLMKHIGQPFGLRRRMLISPGANCCHTVATYPAHLV